MSIIHVDQMKMPLNEIAKITDGELFYSSSTIIKNISLDSREIEEGTLFIAIKGERFDGHDYIGKAFEDGAACIVAERIPYKVKGNVILVDSSLDALGALARTHKEKINPITVAITGSVGKTTTKQFVYSVLSQKYNTHKTDQNFNNEIGMPVTILKMKTNHEALVVEMGMSQKGEISHLTRIALPDIALITNIGNSHIENLGSREGIRDAKLEICEGLKPDGVLVLNGDEPLLANHEGAVYVSLNNPDSDYRAINIVEDSKGVAFDIVSKNGVCKGIRIPVIGIHNVMNAAFAYAVGKSVHISDEDIKAGLLNFENAAMRQNIYEHNGITIIEDCYNASPESMKAALRVLSITSKASSGRAIAVLGDMLELGSYSDKFHYEVGEYVAYIGIDKLYTFGEKAKFIADGAKAGGMLSENIISVKNLDFVEEIGNKLKSELKEKDSILFKASRAVKMERVIEYIK